MAGNNPSQRWKTISNRSLLTSHLIEWPTSDIAAGFQGNPMDIEIALALYSQISAQGEAKLELIQPIVRRTTVSAAHADILLLFLFLT